MSSLRQPAGVILPYRDKTPQIDDSAFIAENAVIIGDVTGHDLGAALIMTTARVEEIDRLLGLVPAKTPGHTSAAAGLCWRLRRHVGPRKLPRTGCKSRRWGGYPSSPARETGCPAR